MDAPAPVEYKNLEIHGPISVEEIDESDNDKLAWGFVILLMGARESGKSTFIETLSLNGATKIELPSSTESIIPYRIKNVTWRGHEVHIVDVPGFRDSKISQMTIVSMLREWMKNAGIQVFYHIVYLRVITSVRLPGSERKVLDTFQSLTGVGAATNVTFATTMWDTIWNEATAKSAEGVFNQLRDVIWGDYIKAGSEMVRFDNTPESALSILDTVAGRYNGAAKFNLEDMVVNKRNLNQSPFAANLLTDLQDRMESLQSLVPSIQNELARAEAEGDMDLVPTLTSQLEEAEQKLHMLQEELQEFQTRPTPDDLDAAPQVHDSDIVATQTPISDSDSDNAHASTTSPGSSQRVSSTLPREDETGDGGAPQVPDASIGALQISSPDLDNDDVHGSTIISTGPPRSDPRMPESPLPKRGKFARARSWVKRSFKSLTGGRANKA